LNLSENTNVFFPEYIPLLVGLSSFNTFYTKKNQTYLCLLILHRKIQKTCLPQCFVLVFIGNNLNHTLCNGFALVRGPGIFHTLKHEEGSRFKFVFY